MNAPTRHCAYCPAELIPFSECDPAKPLPPNLATRDHVIPNRILREFIGPLTPEWRSRNRLWCCDRCNNAKGDMHPMEWLQRLSYEPARQRLAERLMKLCGPVSVLGR